MIHLIETKLLEPTTPCIPPHSSSPVPSHPLFDSSSSVPNSSNSPYKPSIVFSKAPIQSPYFIQETAHPPVNRAFQLPNPFSRNFNAKINHLNGSKNPVKTDGNVETRLEMVAAHISKIDNKLSSLQQQLDRNSLSAPAVGPSVGGQDELLAEASESYRVNIGLGGRRQALVKVTTNALDSFPLFE